ncbi:MAG: DegV family protein [Actinobacteria bacterium HGW-Actinobacteria-7]|nr:MAG: DegV family protein [Actinobacteria bacterium HGW-Actinobacteria-7]
MRKFTVITDSTADIAPDIAAEHLITVVPLSVCFGAETFLDGSISQEEFFARMNAAANLPTTSQPPVGAFVEAYGKALESAEQIISVHISNRLSGTIESARQAAEQFAGKVHVFDSLNLSWGLGLQVMEAAAAAAHGHTVEATLERLAGVRERVKLIVGLDSLDNLARGGRIGKVSAMLGALLNLKVTLTVDEEGAFVPLARSRGERAALEHTMEWVAQQMGSIKRGSFAVGHALSAARTEKLAQAIREKYDVESMVVYEAGVVICTHTGTGWGVAVLPAE